MERESQSASGVGSRRIVSVLVHARIIMQRVIRRPSAPNSSLTNVHFAAECGYSVAVDSTGNLRFWQRTA